MKKFSLVFIGGLVLSITLVMIGCASGPKLGNPTVLQQLLNKLPEVSVVGEKC
jgi:hypothetical protein